MSIVKTLVQGHPAAEPLERGPCRNCGTATPMTPWGQTENGLLCLTCKEEPGQVQSMEAWLTKRRDSLLADLAEVEAELAILQASEPSQGAVPVPGEAEGMTSRSSLRLGMP